MPVRAPLAGVASESAVAADQRKRDTPLSTLSHIDPAPFIALVCEIDNAIETALKRISYAVDKSALALDKAAQKLVAYEQCTKEIRVAANAVNAVEHAVDEIMRELHKGEECCIRLSDIVQRRAEEGMHGAAGDDGAGLDEVLSILHCNSNKRAM